MKRILEKLDSGLASFERAALLALVLAMLVLSALQVFLRLAFSSGILWIDPLSRYLVLWTGFIGAALAAHSGRHFALDIFARRLPDRLRGIAAVCGGVFAAFVSGVFVYAGVRFLKDEAAAGAKLFAIGGFEVPALWLEFMLPFGFLLILLHTVAGLFKPEPLE